LTPLHYGLLPVGDNVQEVPIKVIKVEEEKMEPSQEKESAALDADKV
jgi:hypothetical protein